MSRNGAVRLGLLGAGRWGRNLLRNFHGLGALAAFASVRPESRARVAAAYPGLAIHDHPDALFAAADLDGVVIATPAATHGELAARALDAGKHVFVEKPLCLSLTEAERLRLLAARRGLTLMVGHQMRYHPAFRALQAQIDDGAIGRVRYMYSHRLNPPRPGLQESALWGLAPHDISMLLALGGGLPRRVSATGVAAPPASLEADNVVASFSFPALRHAHLFVSLLHPFRERRLMAAGEDGMIVFDDMAEGAGKLRLYRRRPERLGQERMPPDAVPEAIPYDADEPLRLACAAFLAAVRGEASPLSDADEGLRVLRVLDACQRSLASGMPVDVGGGSC